MFAIYLNFLGCPNYYQINSEDRDFLKYTSFATQFLVSFSSSSDRFFFHKRETKSNSYVQ